MAFVHTLGVLVARTVPPRSRFGAALLKLHERFAGKAASPPAESPLRAELLSAEQMEHLGVQLARAHELRVVPARDRLLERLAENEAALVATCSALAAATAANHRVGPSGEWLLDNFYLVEEQIRTAKRHLPEGYSTQLPQLAGGQSAGRPRVYDIAVEAIAHGDGRVDRESLTRFIAAYQTVTPLNLGELWAIPIMLRLALIENLRRVGTRIGAERRQRDLAQTWSDRMILAAERDPSSSYSSPPTWHAPTRPWSDRSWRSSCGASRGAMRRSRCLSRGSSSACRTRAPQSSGWCSPRTSDRPRTRCP